jgi:dolichol-phosphate mannosyltransferase
MNAKSDVLLILPTRNEREALNRLIAEIPKEYDVLVVDGFSTDGTADAAKDAGYSCVNDAYGGGQGSGIRTGFQHFLSYGYSFLLVMDADYSDNPQDLLSVLSTLKNGGYDIVVGIRDFRKQREYLGLFTVSVKRIISISIYLLTGYRIRDVLSGVWAFRRDTVENLLPRLKEPGFEWGFDITYHAWLLGMKIGERDVDFRRRIGKTKLMLSSRIILVFRGVKYGLLVVRDRLFGVWTNCVK